MPSSGKNDKIGSIARRTFIAGSALTGAFLSLGQKLWAAGGSIFREAPVARIGSGNQCVLRFAHITDTHYYVIDDASANAAAFETYMKSRMGWHTEEPAADIYAELRRRNVEFAVHTGDILDYVTDENLSYFNRMCGNLPFPVHYCLGNHDYNTLEVDSDAKPHWGFINEAANLAMWKKQTGVLKAPYYTFFRNGYRFICLDNSLKKFNAAQLTWLDEQLAASAEPCILAFHIPLYSKQLAEAVGRIDLLMPPEGDIYDVLARHDNVNAILAGHVHRDFETNVNGIPQYITECAYHRAFRIVECYA